MPSTQQDWQNLILIEVGAALDAPTRPELDVISPNIAALFDMYADKAYYPRLQYLFVKRQCIEMLMGQLRRSINSGMGGVSVSYNQAFQNLAQIHKDASEEIDRVLKEARANRAGAAVQGGPMQVADTPLGSVVGTQAGEMFDPNAPAYRGDPRSNSRFPGGRYGV